MNHTSIYSVFFMCLCNLKARFTPVFLKITLIPHLLMFCRIRKKIKQNDGRNQVKRNLLIYSSLLVVVKHSFTSTKECFATVKLKSRNTSLGFATAKLSFTAMKRFATVKPLFAATKEGIKRRQPSSSPQQRNL